MTTPINKATPAAILLALACSSVALAVPNALAPGDAAPELKGKLMPREEKVVIDWSEASLTVVNFWATWCTYCKDQMPLLQHLWAKRGADGVRVIGVYDQNLPIEEIQGYYEPLGVQYPILKAHRRTNEFWGGIHAMPTSFLINSQGRILRRYVGGTPEQTRGLIDDVDAVLSGRPMGKLIIPQQPAVSEPPATLDEAAQRKRELEDR